MECKKIDDETVEVTKEVKELIGKEALLQKKERAQEVIAEVDELLSHFK